MGAPGSRRVKDPFLHPRLSLPVRPDSFRNYVVENLLLMWTGTI